MQRAYAFLHVKSHDVQRRVISGIATTPNPDRVGDVLESRGASFRNPVPLLLGHKSELPVGTATLHPGTDGIRFEAHLPEIDEPGELHDRVKLAWQSVKAGLLRGASIGFRPLKDGYEALKDGGLRFTKFEILELSLVAVPANADCTLDLIKSYDNAKSVPGRTVVTTDGTSISATPTWTELSVSGVMPGATGSRAGHRMTFQEQMESFSASRDSKQARMKELMTKQGGDPLATLDESEEQEFELLEREVKDIDKHLARLATMETMNKAAAKPVSGHSADAGSHARGGHTVTVAPQKLPPGIGFARAVKAATVARLDGRNMLQVAQEMYPSDERLHGHIKHVLNLPNVISHLKAAVPAGTTVQADWAADLVDPTNLAGEFIEYLRPATIIGKFGTNGIPDLRRVPFNVRMIEQTQGGTGYWVGQGAPKPLTAFGFNAVTLAFTKVAAISVITEELARFSTPSAETLVRDGLRDALVERIDRDFIDPAEAGTANVQPASITNGLVALTSAGTSADNARTDLANLMEAFVANNLNPQGVVLIMPTTLALALSFQVNSLGQPEFPNLSMAGGTLNGIPVITSQYAANASGGGNLVIAVNAREVFLADDGQVTVDASREASLQMLDNPTNNSATATATTMVSMWQTNSIALRAERFINWAKRRTNAVVYMDDVNWGAIGSPS